MRQLTQAERDLIVLTLSENKGSYEKTSKILGISARIVYHVDVTENKRYNFTAEGRGKLALQKYIVAIRDLTNGGIWDNSDPLILKARKDYDDGKVEMMTGRDGMNLILYAVPRRIKADRKPWFSSNVVPLRA